MKKGPTQISAGGRKIEGDRGREGKIERGGEKEKRGTIEWCVT